MLGHRTRSETLSESWSSRRRYMCNQNPSHVQCTRICVLTKLSLLSTLQRGPDRECPNSECRIWTSCGFDAASNSIDAPPLLSPGLSELLENVSHFPQNAPHKERFIAYPVCSPDGGSLRQLLLHCHPYLQSSRFEVLEGYRGTKLRIGRQAIGRVRMDRENGLLQSGMLRIGGMRARRMRFLGDYMVWVFPLMIAWIGCQRKES